MERSSCGSSAATRRSSTRTALEARARLAGLSRDRFGVIDGNSLELWEIGVASRPPPRVEPRFRALHAAGSQFIARAKGGGATLIDSRTRHRSHSLPELKGEVLYADDRVVLCNDAWYVTLHERTGRRIGQARDNHFDSHDAIAAVTRNGTLLAGALYDTGHVELVDVRNDKRPPRLGKHASPIVAIAFDGQRGDHVFVACADSTVSVWSTDTGTLVRTFAATVAKQMLGSEHGWIVLMDEARDLHTFDVSNTRHVTIRGPFASFRIGASGREIVTANESSIASWNPITGDLLANWDVGEPITELAASETYVAWLDSRGEVQLIERDDSI